MHSIYTSLAHDLFSASLRASRSVSRTLSVCSFARPLCFWSLKMPDVHLCSKSFPCTYCGFGFEDPPLYPDREKKRAKQATEQREQRKLRERTQIRAGSRTLGLEEEQLQFSNHTAATALGLSLQFSNFSKDQDGPDTPLERGESSTSSWRGFSFRP